MNLMLAVAVVLGAQAAPEQAEKIVTVKRKATVWSFAEVPERRMKLTEGKQVREVDVPAQLWAGWAAVAPQGGPDHPNSFEARSQQVLVELYTPGKSYNGDAPDLLADQKRASISHLVQTLLERFCEFDLDFPGGSWGDLGGIIQERLATAYAQQIPEILKPHVPGKLQIEVATPADYVVRYPALQAKGITLAQLGAFGLHTRLQVHLEAAPRMIREEGGVSLSMDTTAVPNRWILSDQRASGKIALDVAFFNLGERPQLPSAEDVVALFEMAWKARSAPVLARVKYHPETRTIMLHATPEEVAAARSAFASLTGRAATPEPMLSANPFDSITIQLQRIAQLLEKKRND